MIPTLTMLNVMAGGDFAEQLDRMAGWGLEVVDLKNGIYGKSIADLTGSEASEAAEALRVRGLSAYCFSTDLFYDDVAKGERHFRERFLSKLDGLLGTAELLKPELIRLLAARVERRADIPDSTAYLLKEAPWLFEVYREAIDGIAAAGFRVTIENEVHGCIWSTPDEVESFFRVLDRPDKAHFTYDVQNLWEMGTFPSLDVYERLKPLIGFLHLKGGQTEGGSGSAAGRPAGSGADADGSVTGGNGKAVIEGAAGPLVWKSALEDASWPVAAIMRQAVRDGVSPVICLNPSHGKRKEGYSYDDVVERDLRYARALIEETAKELGMR